MTLLLDQDDRPRAFTDTLRAEARPSGTFTDPYVAVPPGPPEHAVTPSTVLAYHVEHHAPRGFTDEAQRIDIWLLEVCEHVADVQSHRAKRDSFVLGEDWVPVEMTEPHVSLPRNVVGSMAARAVPVKRELVVAPLDWFDDDDHSE